MLAPVVQSWEKRPPQSTETDTMLSKAIKLTSQLFEVVPLLLLLLRHSHLSTVCGALSHPSLPLVFVMVFEEKWLPKSDAFSVDRRPELRQAT